MPTPIPETPGVGAAPLSGRHSSAFAMEPRTFSGFLVAVSAVIIIAVLSYDSVRQTAATSQSLTRAIEALAQIQGIASSLKDAETGQRGYLLTGREMYLGPFYTAKQALPLEMASARSLVADDPAQQHRLQSLAVLANEKMEELDETVQLRRSGNADAAMAEIKSDRGMDVMQRIRQMSEEMQNSERRLVTERAAACTPACPNR